MGAERVEKLTDRLQGGSDTTQITGFNRERPPRGGFSTGPDSVLSHPPPIGRYEQAASLLGVDLGLTVSISLLGRSDKVIELGGMFVVGGTFRTSRDVRFETGMQRKADATLPDTFSVDVRAGAIFRNVFRLICPVQSRFQK